MKEVLKIKLKDAMLEGELTVPENPLGLVIFSHGSGSSRFSPRNNFVAQYFQRLRLATLLLDLLTKEEDKNYSQRFNIDLLSERLMDATQYLLKIPVLNNLSAGFFGASTGASFCPYCQH